MKITKAWIEKWEPCSEAVDWLHEQDTKDVFELIRRLRRSDINDKYLWLFWAISRLLRTKRDRVRFAVYAASLALPIFEARYPSDKRPREAIAATRAWIKNPTKKNRIAAESAGWNAEWSVAWSFPKSDREKDQARIVNYGVRLLKERRDTVGNDRT